MFIALSLFTLQKPGSPVAELPALILAMDHRRGPITRVMLGHGALDAAHTETAARFS
ncbi:hypothetical protein [Actinopolymorpha alba]|uniref:hypothetical protein n=1 Tax=Actinopolymorpha alba TaxID=533267 RepID=UPI0003792818|nr:hypothetical protein [Actinopolymorpha alba]